MLPLGWTPPKHRPFRVLCAGAHPDDIEIGCGGTLRRLIGQHRTLEVTWAVFSGNATRRREADRSARAFLGGCPTRRVRLRRFRESFFPSQWARIKEAFESLRAYGDPDIVFTHFRDDRHQDHRVLSDLAWNTFRDHLILEYEVPKYDGDFGQPNLFVALSQDQARQKVQLILQHFRSQKSKHWFDSETFRGLMRLRGMECASRYAEAFYCRKCVVAAR
jgi:LmbE family N-acetylglucosaminyl deacetylase